MIAPGEGPVAFPVAQARAALADGERVRLGSVELVADGDGLRARAAGGNGEKLPAHQAFWFAWSQFYPGTELWAPPSEQAE